MTDHPMDFTAPAVKALLEGRKTQDRRILRPLKGSTLADYVPSGRKSASGYEYLRLPREKIAEPMWRVGDLIWVREAWQYAPQKYCLCPQGSEPEPCDDWKEGIGCQSNRDGVVYRADHGGICRWRSPIYMARRDSRITLTVVEVRVQRVQEITEKDAVAEGATSRPNAYGFSRRSEGWSMDWSEVGRGSEFGQGPAVGKKWALTKHDISLGSAKDAFVNFINTLHGGENWNLKRSNIWNENPFVAALTFTVALRNIDDASVKGQAA